MPKYKLNKRHYLNDRLVHAGETVSWDGPPSLAMTPLDASATKAKENWDADRKQRQSTRRRVGWTPGLQNHLWRNLTLPDPELRGANGEAVLPMSNVNVVGQAKRTRSRAAAAE